MAAQADVFVIQATVTNARWTRGFWFNRLTLLLLWITHMAYLLSKWLFSIG